MLTTQSWLAAVSTCRQGSVLSGILSLMHAKGTHQTSLLASGSCLVACAGSAQQFHDTTIDVQGPVLDAALLLKPASMPN